MNAPAVIADPLVSALGFVTAPYARGAATQVLQIGPAAGGQSTVLAYSFATFQARYGVQTADLSVSYMLTLLADLGEEPSTVVLTYVNDRGSGTGQVVVPAGALAGTSFVIPIPRDGGLATLQTLQETPAPAVGSPAGPDKWRVTALMGNFSRLLALLLAERQALTGQARDVLAQSSLPTSRGASLDLIGEALAVPRLLPAPYRLDLDPAVVALYHFDDAVAPVVDATGEHPGVSHGAPRAAAGKIGTAAQITAAGGITIPSAPEFAISAGASFTVEMFAQVNSVAANVNSVLAAKRANIASSNGSGWALTVEGVDGSKANLRFTLADHAGMVVEAVTPQPVAVSGWFHIAGVLDGAGHQALIYLNGAVAATAGAAGLQAIGNGADIGLGADRTGAAAMAGMLDEVRFSSSARTSFASVIGGASYAPDPTTIALYHLDESDDWIDEDRGAHYAVNHGAVRGVAGRFDVAVRFPGDPLPEAHCPSEIEFQRRLRSGAWDRGAGGAPVKVGPYARFGYRQGAISLPGLGAPQPVMINDGASIGARSRGMVTTACYGFVPTDLAQTIARFTQAGRTAQEAIDFFGDWQGQPEGFFTQQYQANGITAPHQSCLPVPGTPTWIEIPRSPDFALDVKTSLTVEALIKPDPTLDNYPRAIAASRSSGLREGEPNGNEAGWALSLDRYGYIPNNLCWTLGDAAGNLVGVTAGRNLGDGAFHHVAGVLDRDAGTALLFVDGMEVAKAPVGALGVATGPGTIVLGNDPAFDAPYAGVLDEVRISRLARRSFHPVLGESDARFRQRLALFERFRIPSAETIRRAVAIISRTVNAADPPDQATKLLLSDDPVSDGQLTVEELDSTRFCASRRFRLMPGRLVLGQSIDSTGSLPADEAVATGSYDFHPEALLRQDDLPGVTFADESCRWMILSAARGLAALAARVQAIAPAAQVAVQKALDATSSPLHAQGRSLDVALSNAPAGLDLGLLGALAHEIGIDYVAYDPSGFLRLSFAGGMALDIAAPDTVAPGAVVPISVARPKLPHTGLTWRLLCCGAGNGTLASDPTNAEGRRFAATAPGQVTITAQIALPGGAILSGAKTVTIAPDTLAGCTMMAADGREDVTEIEAAGAPDTDFREAYLVRVDDPRLDYASDNARRMQLPLENALLRLATLAAAEPNAPRVRVLAAYDPAATTLQAVGRGLVVAPSDNKMTAARLGALALRSGFAYIATRRYPPAIYASVAAGNRFAIIRSPIRRVWANARIGGQGQFMATESAAAGPPDAGFTTAMLQPYTAAGVTFATGVSNQVQATLAAALTALTAALAANAAAGNVQIVAGFNPSGSDLTKVGRAVLMRHPALSADRLAGYALQAGFAFVHHRTDTPSGPAVYAAAYAAGAAPLSVFSDDDVMLDAVTELDLRPVLPIAGSLDWCVVPCCGAAATLTTALPDPATAANYAPKFLRGQSGGTITIDASFSLNDAADPYQCILLPNASNGSEPRLTKDQYDDLLNFLDAYHPVGVEVVSRGIRRFVHGFRRPPNWDQIPTNETYRRYRINR